MARNSVPMLVRIKPFDKRRNQLTRRYTYRGTRFEEDRGWYQVPSWVAEEMKGLRHPSTGLRMFDVATPDRAVEIEEEEQAEEVQMSPAARPNMPKSFRGEDAVEKEDPDTPAPDPEPIAEAVGSASEVATKVAKKKASKKKAKTRARRSS